MRSLHIPCLLLLLHIQAKATRKIRKASGQPNSVLAIGRSLLVSLHNPSTAARADANASDDDDDCNDTQNS